MTHHEILEEIGHGGMAVVFRAVDTKLGREVALKRPWSDGPVDRGVRRRFLREARAASSLAHPNIAAVYEAFEESGVPWLSMELIDGRSLRSLLEKGETLPTDEILRHAADLADALRHAHSKRILHRDITPGNIIIGRNGRARLLDFGLARYFVPHGLESEVSTQETDLTADGCVVGTPGYMSPEQTLGRPLDSRSDIFSFGAVLYQMCTGIAPFTGSDRGAVTDAILNREPKPVSQLNYEIPAELERIIRKCLAKNPAERYQGTADLVADLRALRRQSQSTPRADPGSAPGARWVTAIVAGLTVGISIVLGTWVILPRACSGPTPEKLEQFDARARAYFERGLQYYRNWEDSLRKLNEAIQMFHRAVEIEPGFADAWAELGSAYWSRYSETRDEASRQEAIDAVNRAFALDDDLPRAFAARGNGSSVMEDHEAARDDLERAVAGDPNDDFSWAMLGHAYGELGDYPKALEALSTAIDLSPGQYKHRIWLGLFYFHYSENEAAVRAYNEAIELKPDSTTGLNNLAAVYLRMERTTEAIEALEKSMAIQETDSGRSLLGTARYSLGDYEGAASEYRRATEIEPERAVHWSNLGDALRMLGRTEEMRAAYLEAADRQRLQVEQMPSDPRSRMRLGLYCARAGETDCALEEGQRAAAMQPENAQVLFRVAVIYCVVGTDEEALDWLEKAVRLGLTRAEIRMDPDLARLSEDPRFKRILGLAS